MTCEFKENDDGERSLVLWLKRVHDATETDALPHVEQFRPMRMLRGDARCVYVYKNVGTLSHSSRVKSTRNYKIISMWKPMRILLRVAVVIRQISISVGGTLN